MCRVQPVIGTDENQFAVFVQLLDAFQDEDEQVVALAFEIGVPEAGFCQLFFQLGFQIFPPDIGRVSDDAIERICCRRR